MKIKLDKEALILTPCSPNVTKEIAEKNLKEVNNEFTYWTDPLTNKTIIKCENKPKDSPMCGVIWKMVEG